MFLGPGRKSAPPRPKPFDTHRLGGASPIDFSVHPHHIATHRSASDPSRLSDKDRTFDVCDDPLWIYTFLLSLVISNAGSYDAIQACSHLFIISRLFNRVFNNVCIEERRKKGGLYKEGGKREDVELRLENKVMDTKI